MKTADEIMGLVTWYGATCVGYADGFETGSDLDRSRAALRIAIEALVVDAERYRWLKEHCVLGIYQNGNGWDMGIDGVAPDSKRDIDAAVDAAMTEVKE